METLSIFDIMPDIEGDKLPPINGRDMNILIACEESQRVCTAFREKGHNAFSCDITEPSGGHPEWHIKGDVLKILNPYFAESDLSYGIHFTTMDGKGHFIQGRWDMIIAFPPCTYLTNTGNRWFDVIRYGYDAQKRWDERCKAISFFLKIAYADCKKIVIENPIGCMSTYFRKPDQIIQPFQFGHKARKSTCLWLKNTPLLNPTEVVEPDVYSYIAANGRVKTDSKWRSQLNGEDRAKHRSKTFPGVAKAMAEQWG